jgi:two-component system OmpR family response regulator
MAHILVVDDEPDIRSMLVDAISLGGHTAVGASDGFEALRVIRDCDINLIVADVNMPRIDGYELINKLRESGNKVPVILLTARQQQADITRGLKVGADDYITKPFSLEELLLRIGAVLRRTMPDIEKAAPIEVGPIQLFEDSHTVTVNGKEVELSPTEYKLLRHLMRSPNKVQRKDQLLDAIWGMGFATGATVVDTYISYLRKKLHTDDWAGIKTIRGIGFLISE